MHWDWMPAALRPFDKRFIVILSSDRLPETFGPSPIFVIIGNQARGNTWQYDSAFPSHTIRALL